MAVEFFNDFHLDANLTDMIKITLPWTESPFFEQELADSLHSPEEKAFIKAYAENGYAIIDPDIDPALLDEIVRTLQPTYDKMTTKERRIQDAWKHHPPVRQLATHPNVLKTLQLLYQRTPLPFQTLNFPEGTEQATHSDMIHFGTVPARWMCAVWVALEDINDENGPLHYYPRSHRLPFYDFPDIGLMGSASEKVKRRTMMDHGNDYSQFIEKLVAGNGLKRTRLNIKKGQAIIWASNLLHGGDKILRPGASRFSQVKHYFFPGCMYYTPRLSDMAIGRVWLNDLVNIATGEKIRNTYMGNRVRPSLRTWFWQTIYRLDAIAKEAKRPK